MNKEIIVDGNHTVHRIWNTASGQRLATKSGKPSGVVHGFLMSICTIAKTFKSNNITVVWDHKSDHRTALIEKYNESKFLSPEEISESPSFYKASRYAQRTEKDHTSFHEGLLPQMQDLQYVIPKLGIRQLHVEGVEGDDLIGITVERVCGSSEVVIVSSDHDLWQLLGPDIRLYDPIQKKSFTENDFKAKFGLSPSKFPEIRALSGDANDDIPGIPRIGEKTAAKFIVECGGLREVIEQSLNAPKNALMSTVPNYLSQIELAYNLSYILGNVKELEPYQQAEFENQWRDKTEPSWNDVQTFTDVYELKKVWGLIQEVFNTDEFSNVKTFEELWAKLGDCQRCKLYKTRTNIVRFGGVEHAAVALLGEAPGATEDFWGSPFQGKAGKHMRINYFEPNGLCYEMFHILNTVNCRPVVGNENRPPTKEEIAACNPRLRCQLRLVNPKVVVLIGDKALKVFFPETGKISRERGLIYTHPDWVGIQFIAVFHPSYLMRLGQSHSDVIKSREDWKLIGKMANAERYACEKDDRTYRIP